MGRMTRKIERQRERPFLRIARLHAGDQEWSAAGVARRRIHPGTSLKRFLKQLLYKGFARR